MLLNRFYGLDPDSFVCVGDPCSWVLNFVESFPHEIQTIPIQAGDYRVDVVLGVVVGQDLHLGFEELILMIAEL